MHMEFEQMIVELWTEIERNYVHVYEHDYGNIDDNHYEHSLMMVVMNSNLYVDMEWIVMKWKYWNYDENFGCKNHNDDMMKMRIVTMRMMTVMMIVMVLE